MASCCNNKGSKKVKEWGDNNTHNKSVFKLDPKLIIAGIILIGVVIYKFVI